LTLHPEAATKDLTINGKVAQSGASCPLHFNIGVLEEEENGSKRVPVNSADI
jgi:hypothetical protein